MVYHPLFIAVGAVILIVLLIDLLKTTVQASEGMLSHWVQQRVHSVMEALYRLTGRRVFLVWTSSVIILSMVMAWVLLLYLGWLLIFLGHQDAVLLASNNSPAGFWGRVYFAGFAISTLGVGDYRPGSALWQVLTTAAALHGFFLLTFVISFLISTSEKQNLRRRLALHIHHAGDDPVQLIIEHHDPESGIHLERLLQDITSLLIGFEHQHNDQPMLNRFHSPSQILSVELAVVLLDEAMSIVELGIDTPLPPHYRQARRAISGYLNSLRYIHLDAEDHAPPPVPSLEPLREAGLPVIDQAVFRERFAGLEGRRCRLKALVESTGWGWRDIYRDIPSP